MQGSDARSDLYHSSELVDDAPCGIVVTEPNGRIAYVNKTLAHWMGWISGKIETGVMFSACLTVPGRIYYETHIAPMMRLQGFVREISCELKVERGPPLPVLLSGIARRDAMGEIERFDFTIFDASERRTYEEELREARRQADELAAIVRSSPNAILRVNAHGRIEQCNKVAEGLITHAQSSLERPVSEAIQLKDRPDWFNEAVLQSDEEVVFEAADLSDREFEVVISPIRERDPLADSRDWSIVLRDISAQKQAERHLKVVVAETKHRLKNTIAVIAGIARQTLPHDAAEILTRRLGALAHAHDLLTKANWRSANLREVLDHTSGEAGGADRFRVTGPEVRLSAQQATSLSMALHELVTNALKYGALSVPEGYVTVDYDWEGGPYASSLRLVWQENDGPAVSPPEHRGFGSKMIEIVLKTDLSADIVFDFRKEGLWCEVSFAPGKLTGE
ncbi:Blue-light-activated histidine kinase [Defluviimonas aquaemixtae]|uniref:histidine kinase n=1 Tax=Albidovulum aquaemixtae TaxID=1542388 RepID=A0A2R8B7X9_9RHOB|nr:HWE histidine kinase domain-containing protein [Defluviimonas aquaemixtae]SPH18662.1 Blue-light-activated histidine kinase [Defluviimonas aquaemixtae]